MENCDQDATKKAIDEKLDIIESLIKGTRLDYRKLANGTKVSGTRMRKSLVCIAKESKEARELILEYRNQL